MSELVKATPLDQVDADMLAKLGIAASTVEEVDQLKANAAALPAAQAALEAKQAELAKAVAAKQSEVDKANQETAAALELAGVTVGADKASAVVAASRQLLKTATIEAMQSFRAYVLDTLNGLPNDQPVPTLAALWAAFGGGG